MGVFHSRGHDQEKFQRTLLGKNKKGFKVSGSRNLPLEWFWNMSKEVRIQIAVPPMMRHACNATKHGSWESFKEE